MTRWVPGRGGSIFARGCVEVIEVPSVAHRRHRPEPSTSRVLDTSHGADYFRRWHRNKQNSGGLLVHKATHHFDIVNWWLSTVPATVYAQGARKFYTPQMADRYGLKDRTERCLDCPEKGKCAFYLDLKGNENLRRLYLDNEQHDGYFRDRCVFSDQIDIEDSMQLVVGYENGVRMAYSLNAFMPWEGYIISFNGAKGRLEQKCMETVYISGDGSVPGERCRSRVRPGKMPPR